MKDLIRSIISFKSNPFQAIKRLREYTSELTYPDDYNFVSKCITEARKLDQEAKTSFLTNSESLIYYASQNEILKKFVFRNEVKGCLEPTKEFDIEVIRNHAKKNYKGQYNELIQCLESENYSIISKNKGGLHKLKWIGNPSDIFYLIQELILKGYLALPEEVSKSELSESLVSMFDLADSSKNRAVSTLKKNLRSISDGKGKESVYKEANPFSNIKKVK